MKITDLLNFPVGTILRLISLAGLLLSSAVMMLAACPAGLRAFLYIATVSCSVLQLRPSRESLITASVMEMLSAALSVVLVLTGYELLVTVLFYLAAVVPLVVQRYRESMGMALDKDRFALGIPGWEVAMNSARTMAVAAFAVLSLVLFVVADIGGVWAFVSLLSMAVLGMFLFFRRNHVRETVRPSSPVNVGIVWAKTEAVGKLPEVYMTLYHRMTAYMEEEKPYLDSNFDLDHMSMAVGSNRGYVSRMINTCTGMNFRQYINEYRIKYAVELMKMNKGDWSAMDIAERSGFNNRPSFNMAFKLFMNMTPGEWIREQAAEGNKIIRRRKAPLHPSIPPEQVQSVLQAFSSQDAGN